jgi:hypothetical protein
MLGFLLRGQAIAGATAAGATAVDNDAFATAAGANVSADVGSCAAVVPVIYKDDPDDKLRALRKEFQKDSR